MLLGIVVIRLPEELRLVDVAGWAREEELPIRH